MTQLPVPDFFDPANAERWHFRPDAQRLLERATAWRARLGLAPSADDRVTVRLLLIDLQKDFCFREGALYVGGRSGRGAIDDNGRVASFVYRHLDLITEIACTLDTHLPHQIFFSSFWEDEHRRPPAAHRQITFEDVRTGRWRPNPNLAAWLTGGDQERLRRHALRYCEQLEQAGNYTLYLWPPHCLLGSSGHALAGIIQEAQLFHAYARESCGPIEIKGSHPLTEHYSALSPEAPDGPDAEPIGGLNTELACRLLSSDALIVAGQAASHCVRSTVEDLEAVIGREDPSLMGRVYILEDCMSAVTVPDPRKPGRYVYDFTQEAREALSRFAAAGMHVVRSTDPPGSWPDFPTTA